MSHRLNYMSDSQLWMSGRMSVGPDIESIDQTLKISIKHWCVMVTHIQMENGWHYAHGCPRKNAAKTVVYDERTIINTDSYIIVSMLIAVAVHSKWASSCQYHFLLSICIIITVSTASLSPIITRQTAHTHKKVTYLQDLRPPPRVIYLHISILPNPIMTA